jgi:hypothetical protein
MTITIKRWSNHTFSFLHSFRSIAWVLRVWKDFLYKICHTIFLSKTTLNTLKESNCQVTPYAQDLDACPATISSLLLPLSRALHACQTRIRFSFENYSKSTNSTFDSFSTSNRKKLSRQTFSLLLEILLFHTFNIQ